MMTSRFVKAMFIAAAAVSLNGAVASAEVISTPNSTAVSAPASAAQSTEMRGHWHHRPHHGGWCQWHPYAPRCR